MNVQEISIDKIIPYWHNPRNNEKTVERLVGSIKDYGFNVPLVVNKDMVLITGHARLKAARKIGLASVPCVVVDLTEEQAKKYRIADNKIQELTDWRDDELFKELREIGDQFELLNMGFDMDEIKDVVGAFDAVVEQSAVSVAAVEEVVASAVAPAPTPAPIPAVQYSADVQPAEAAVQTYATAAVMDNAEERERQRRELEEALRKRELELNGRFVKESYEQHSKDNLVICPHCGESFKVRGLS